MLNNFHSSLKKLPTSARRSLLVAFSAMLLVALPIMVWGLVTGNFELRKRAASGEPLLNPISISTSTVTLSARDHYILANGQKYVINTSTLAVSSDSGNENFTSLILNWEDNGKRLGLRLYFNVNQGNWTVSEILATMGSTDSNLGLAQTFTGPFPVIPKGQAFTGTFSYSGSLPYGLNGYLYIDNLYLYPNFMVNPVPTVPTKPICAKSTIKPVSGPAPLLVALHGGGQTSDKSGIEGYQWDFENDGYWDTDISLEPVSHIYDQPGTYYPKYRIHSTNGLWSDICDYAYPIIVSPLVSTFEPVKFAFKFGGITSKPNDDSIKKILFYATGIDTKFNFASASQRQEIELLVDDNGVYHGEILFPTQYLNYHYRLRVKGPKHLQEVFDDVILQKDYEIDLTGKSLRPGDLNQDGVLDKTDLTEINKRIFSNKVEDVSFADVNFDGRVDIIDRTLILNTLSVQFDQE